MVQMDAPDNWPAVEDLNLTKPVINKVASEDVDNLLDRP